MTVQPPYPHMTPPDIRFQKLDNWLLEIVDQPRVNLAPASADASFRRYFRLQTVDNSYVAMDAPPDKEPIRSFLQCAEALNKQDVHVPNILSFDEENGFILMEDLGGTPYLDALREHPDALYRDAIKALHQIQGGGRDQPERQLPTYDAAKLIKELNVFEHWYLKRHLDVQMTETEQTNWDDVKNLLVESCLEQPQVWVHRDYHSRNLMVTDGKNPGVIDFQDMVVGPIAYDLVSLFKDCYIDWPRGQQLSWCELFLRESDEFSHLKMDQLTRWYDLTGLQRHLKVLGVFCRLHYRDGKSHYLKDLPLVREYVQEVLPLYSELRVFEKFFNSLSHL